jgi:ribosomal protein L37AE/L43A
MANCIKCGKHYSPARAKLGITTCLVCGDREAGQARMGWCVAQEYNKGAYQLVTNLDTLKQTNPKRTT